MFDEPLDSVQMNDLVGRWQVGDDAAADLLLRTVMRRLEHVARKMLRGFPALRREVDTMDVVQESAMRLLHALRQFRPESTRHFFNLAAVQVRRELLDLARKCRAGRLHELPPAGVADECTSDGLAGVADCNDDNLDLWCRFHEAVDQLPGDEREVVGLTFYHGWKQNQIAELFGVDERTIRRRWRSACARLNGLVGGRLPAP